MFSLLIKVFGILGVLGLIGWGMLKIGWYHTVAYTTAGGFALTVGPIVLLVLGAWLLFKTTVKIK